ncbi:hypothetical protein TorRG33x02_171130, partial [Trema orientale]
KNTPRPAKQSIFLFLIFLSFLPSNSIGKQAFAGVQHLCPWSSISTSGMKQSSSSSSYIDMSKEQSSSSFISLFRLCRIEKMSSNLGCCESAAIKLWAGPTITTLLQPAVFFTPLLSMTSLIISE